MLIPVYATTNYDEFAPAGAGPIYVAQVTLNVADTGQNEI
jgi:hypothetical protein